MVMQIFLQVEGWMERLLRHVPFCGSSSMRECRLRRFVYAVILGMSFVSFSASYFITSGYYRASIESHVVELADGYFGQVQTMILAMRQAGSSSDTLRHSIETPPSGNGVLHARLAQKDDVGVVSKVAALARRAQATGVIQTSWDGERLTRVYPLKAEQQCLVCHPGSRLGDVLGAVIVTADLRRTIVATEKRIFLLFLCLFPIPLGLAFLLAAVLHGKISRAINSLHDRIAQVSSVRDLNLLVEKGEINLGFTELNSILREFNVLAQRVRSVAVDKEILLFEMQVLEKFILTSEVVRDWREHVKNLLVEMNRILEVAVLFTVFQVDEETYDVEIFWYRACPSQDKEEAFEKIVLERALAENPRLRGGVDLQVKHNIVDSSRPLEELDLGRMGFHLKSLILQAPKIGGVVGIGIHATSVNDDIRSLVIESVLATLLNVIGSIKAIAKYTSELEYYATRDPLTNLYNQRLFWELIGYEKSRADRHQYRFSLLIIDLDNFKNINDSHGHVVGDKVLVKVADAIHSCLRQGDILARYGGDEFVAVLPESAQDEALVCAERICRKLDEFSMTAEDSTRVKVTCSVGLAEYPEHASSVKDLFIMADNVMYKAKHEGKNTVRIPTVTDIADVFKKVGEQALIIRNAIDDRAILPYFQPIIESATGRVVGHEVLSRIIGADGRVLPAGMFIETAERIGLITRLDQVLMENLFTRIRDEVYDGLIFLNLSPKSLIVKDYVPTILSLAHRYGVHRERIVFEITERDTVRNIGMLEQFVRSLKIEGFQFAIDDFGSGFSSFQYIKRLPIDFVKIEGEFVKNMIADSRDRLFVRTMAILAEEFNIRTIAEFVESAEVFKLVQDAGIDYCQGYYLGSPAPDFYKVADCDG